MKLVIFDLDDTLIDTSGSVTPFKLRALIEWLARSGVEIGAIEQAYEDLCQVNQISKSSADAIRKILQRFNALSLLEESLAFFTAPLPTHFFIPTTPRAKESLEILKKKGYQIALVTGGKPSFQLEKMEKAGLEGSFFSKIAIPEDSKKGPHYKALLKEFSILPHEALVVGDRIPMDLVPAHALGIRTVHMRWGRGLLWKTEEWVDHSICELSELLEIL